MVDSEHGVNPSGFRPDIQGLRAIAVLLVLIFHVFPDSLSGGYVGVDIFFVISGFLISGILVRDSQKHGRVRLGNFYERRARRLLPAACATIIVSGLAAFAILLETRWETTGWEALASGFYFENFSLYVQSLDYLAADYVASRFQHYWPLPIDEQFYFAWPLLVTVATFLAMKAKLNHQLVLGATFALIFAASLVSSIVLTPNDPGAYFLTQARAWELALGGLVALTAPHLRLPDTANAILRWAGIAMMLVAGITFTSDTPFPGTAALIPTIGAALLLVTPMSDRNWDPSRLLSLTPKRYSDDIFYSLYLWQWPVVIFATTYLRPEGFNLFEGLGLIAVSIALAHFPSPRSKTGSAPSRRGPRPRNHGSSPAAFWPARP